MLTVGIFVFVEVEALDFAGPFELPKALIEAGARWIDERDVVTSSGISAGIDMSLHHLVRRLAGVELAAATARQWIIGGSIAEAPRNKALQWTGPCPAAERQCR